jgi:hypothetical protein
MEKPSQSVFARAKLSVTQVLTFWLMITLKWNTRIVLLVLKLLTFPSKGGVSWKRSCLSRAVSVVHICHIQDE